MRSASWSARAAPHWDSIQVSRARAAYLGAGVYQSRAANGTLRETDTGFIGTLGVQSPGRLQLFGELQFLKDGALSTQVLTGLGVRIW